MLLSPNSLSEVLSFAKKNRKSSTAIDDNETTAIYELPNAKVTNVQVGKSYNLNGQRVGNATNGLIVRDGKKIIVNNQYLETAIQVRIKAVCIQIIGRATSRSADYCVF